MTGAHGSPGFVTRGDCVLVPWRGHRPRRARGHIRTTCTHRSRRLVHAIDCRLPIDALRGQDIFATGGHQWMTGGQRCPARAWHLWHGGHLWMAGGDAARTQLGAGAAHGSRPPGTPEMHINVRHETTPCPRRAAEGPRRRVTADVTTICVVFKGFVARSAAKWPGLAPQVGYTRLAALVQCVTRASPSCDAIHVFAWLNKVIPTALGSDRCPWSCCDAAKPPRIPYESEIDAVGIRRECPAKGSTRPGSVSV